MAATQVAALGDLYHQVAQGGELVDAHHHRRGLKMRQEFQDAFLQAVGQEILLWPQPGQVMGSVATGEEDHGLRGEIAELIVARVIRAGPLQLFEENPVPKPGVVYSALQESHSPSCSVLLGWNLGYDLVDFREPVLLTNRSLAEQGD